MATDSGIRPAGPDEPWYWQYDGEPTLLLGGSNTDNLFQWTGDALTDHLDELVAVGGNYLRNTLSDRGGNDVYAFAEVRDGVYDLDRWNEEYFDRLETLLDETAARDVVVHLTLWDEHDHGGGLWDRHPWNPYNNVNYGRYESGVTGGNDIIAPVDRNDPVYPYVAAFVDRALDIALEYDHVLYNINNESRAGEVWETHWGEHIHERADDAGTEAFVTNMNMWPGQSVGTVRRNPDTFDFVELSQANQHSKGFSGQAHWDEVQAYRAEIAEELGPRPVNNVKIYGGLTQRDNYGSAVEATQRFWRNLLGGAASARFHRPMGSDGTAGIGLTERARAHIRSARDVFGAVDVFGLEPALDLLSDRAENEAYAAAAPGEEYLVYFLDGGTVSLDLGDLDGSATLRWYDADGSEWGSETTVEGGSARRLSAPGDGSWLAIVQA